MTSKVVDPTDSYDRMTKMVDSTNSYDITTIVDSTNSYDLTKTIVDSTSSFNMTTNFIAETQNGFTNIQISSFVVYTILLCIGAPGNLAIVLRVVTDRKLQSPTFVAVSGLAAADFLFLCCRIPLELINLLHTNWIYGSLLCKLSYFVFQTASYSAAYHLVLMAVIRYYLLVRPLSAVSNLTTKKSRFASLTIWSLAALLLLPVAITSDVEKYRYKGNVYEYCSINPNDKNSWKIFTVSYMLFSYLLPLMMITVLHCVKMRAVARASRAVADKHKRQLSAMVVVVIMTFGILLLPVHVKNVLQTFLLISQTKTIQTLDLFFRALAYANSCVNPFVYAFMSVQFRNSLKRLCRCCKASPVVTSSVYQMSDVRRDQTVVSVIS